MAARVRERTDDFSFSGPSATTGELAQVALSLSLSLSLSLRLQRCDALLSHGHREETDPYRFRKRICWFPDPMAVAVCVLRVPLSGHGTYLCTSEPDRRSEERPPCTFLDLSVFGTLSLSLFLSLFLSLVDLAAAAAAAAASLRQWSLNTTSHSLNRFLGRLSFFLSFLQPPPPPSSSHSAASPIHPSSSPEFAPCH